MIQWNKYCKYDVRFIFNEETDYSGRGDCKWQRKLSFHHFSIILVWAWTGKAYGDERHEKQTKHIYASEILVEDSDTGSPSSITIWMGILTSFSILIVKFVWKVDEGKVESIVLLIFVLWWCFNCQWWGEGRKSYLGPTEIASFSNWDFSRSSKYDTFWHVWTRHFCVLYLWAIAVSHFRLWKFIRTLAFPCSIITFTVSSHTGYHFCNYIYLFQILYSMKSFFY